MSQLARTKFSVLLVRDILISLCYLFFGRLFPRLRFKWEDLAGKNIIVTGANSGIGFALAVAFLRRDATVYLACRDVARGKEAASLMISATGGACAGRIHVVELDLSNLASVHSFARSWMAHPHAQRRIDVLFHNAGIMFAPEGTDRFTVDAIDTIYATNHLGAFLLTSLLDEALTCTARVILTSSFGLYGVSATRLAAKCRMKGRDDKNVEHKASYSYEETKLMQVIFARQLQECYDSHPARSSRIVHTFSPGMTASGVFDKISTCSKDASVGDKVRVNMTRLFSRVATKVEEGSATGVWLASTQDSRIVGVGNTGMHWERLERRRTIVETLSQETLQLMWQAWERDAGIERYLPQDRPVN